MENYKRVISREEMVINENNLILPKGTIFTIEDVSEEGIVIGNNDVFYMVDMDFFETNFDIYSE